MSSPDGTGARMATPEIASSIMRSISAITARTFFEGLLRVIVRIISATTCSTIMSPRNSLAAGSGRTARNNVQASPTR